MSMSAFTQLLVKDTLQQVDAYTKDSIEKGDTVDAKIMKFI